MKDYLKIKVIIVFLFYSFVGISQNNIFDDLIKRNYIHFSNPSAGCWNLLSQESQVESFTFYNDVEFYKSYFYSGVPSVSLIRPSQYELHPKKSVSLNVPKFDSEVNMDILILIYNMNRYNYNSAQ